MNHDKIHYRHLYNGKYYVAKQGKGRDVFLFKNTQEIIVRNKEKIPELLYADSHDR